MRVHAQAVLDLLKAVPNLTVYDGSVPDRPALPYAVAYPGPGAADRSALEAVSDTVTTIVQVTCVGQTRDSAAVIADKVSDSLLDTVLDVPGWVCSPIVQDRATDLPIKDLDVVPPVFYAVTQWRLITAKT